MRFVCKLLLIIACLGFSKAQGACDDAFAAHRNFWSRFAGTVVGAVTVIDESGDHNLFEALKKRYICYRASPRDAKDRCTFQSDDYLKSRRFLEAAFDDVDRLLKNAPIFDNSSFLGEMLTWRPSRNLALGYYLDADMAQALELAPELVHIFVRDRVIQAKEFFEKFYFADDAAAPRIFLQEFEKDLVALRVAWYDARLRILSIASERAWERSPFRSDPHADIVFLNFKRQLREKFDLELNIKGSYQPGGIQITGKALEFSALRMEAFKQSLQDSYVNDPMIAAQLFDFRARNLAHYPKILWPRFMSQLDHAVPIETAALRYLVTMKKWTDYLLALDDKSNGDVLRAAAHAAMRSLDSYLGVVRLSAMVEAAADVGAIGIEHGQPESFVAKSGLVIAVPILETIGGEPYLLMLDRKLESQTREIQSIFKRLNSRLDDSAVRHEHILALEEIIRNPTLTFGRRKDLMSLSQNIKIFVKSFYQGSEVWVP